MPDLRRLDLWSDVECAAGARCLGFVGLPLPVEQTDHVSGEANLTLTVPAESPIAPDLTPNRVLRLRMNPPTAEGWEVVERRIAAVARRRSPGGTLLTVTARGLLQDLGTRTLIGRRTALGNVEYAFASGGLTLAQHLAWYILPALERAGQPWWSAGQLDVTTPIDFTYNNDTPLSALQRMAGDLGLELAARALVSQTSFAGVGYAIDLVSQICGDVAPLVVTLGREILGAITTTTVDDEANVIACFGATGELGTPTTMANARWVIAAMDATTNRVALADPRGGAGPIGFDGQFDSGYGLRWSPTSPPLRIIGSYAATQELEVVSVADLQAASLAVGSTVWIARWYAPIGGNQLVNGDAETGSPGQHAPGWTQYSGVPLLINGSQHRSGLHCLAFTPTASQGGTGYERLTGLRAGTYVRFAGFFWTDGHLDPNAAGGLQLIALLPGPGLAYGPALKNVSLLSPSLPNPFLEGASAVTLTGPGDTVPRYGEIIARLVADGDVAAFAAVGQSATGHLYFDDLVLEVVDPEAGDVTELTRPDHVLADGRRVGTLNRQDVPDTVNVVPNSAFRRWVAWASSLFGRVLPGTAANYPEATVPDQWFLDGSAADLGGATIVPDTEAEHWKTSGASARVVLPAGAMLVSVPFKVTPSALRAYLSAAAQVYTEQGQVVLEVMLTDAATGATHSYLWPQDAGGPPVPTKGIPGGWDVPALAGLDLINHDLGWVQLRLRAITAFTGNVDLVQLTQTASDRPLAEGAAPTSLWQAANAQLAAYGTPAIGLSADWLDLEAASGGQLASADVLRPGLSVLLRDPEDQTRLATRILGITRQWGAGAATPQVELAKTALGLTRVLSKPLPVPRPPVIITRGVTPEPPPLPPLETLVTIWQANATGEPPLLLAVLAPNPTVSRYRLYRKKGGWPTTDGTAAGDLDPFFFVCERSTSPDGGGVLANGQACPGGTGEHDLKVVAWDSPGPNADVSYAAGEVCYLIAVPLRGDEVGTRATIAYTVVTFDPALGSRTFPAGVVSWVDCYGPYAGAPALPGGLNVQHGAWSAAPAGATIELAESIDGSPWTTVVAGLPSMPYPYVFPGRGAGYVAGGVTDRLVVWQWRVIVRSSAGAIISAAVSPPRPFRAVQLLGATRELPIPQ